MFFNYNQIIIYTRTLVPVPLFLRMFAYLLLLSSHSAMEFQELPLYLCRTPRKCRNVTDVHGKTQIPENLHAFPPLCADPARLDSHASPNPGLPAQPPNQYPIHPARASADKHEDFT